MTGFTIEGFTGGILSPEIHGRVGFDKTKLALADASNVSIKSTGAALMRVGTQMIAPCKFAEKNCYFIKFGSSREAIYNIEVGDLYMRFFRAGSAIVITYPITNGDFPTDIAGWTDLSSGGVVSWNAVDERMVLDGSLGTAQVSQSTTTVLNQDYTLVLDVVTTKLKVTIGTTSGGSEILEKTIHPGTGRQVFFKAVGTTTHIGFKQDDTVISEIDNIVGTQPFELTTTYLEADIRKIRYVQQGETLYLTHPTYPPRKLVRTSDTVWSITDMTFDPIASNLTVLTLVASGTPSVPRVFDWDYTVSAIYEDITGKEIEGLPYTIGTVTGDIEISDKPVTVSFTGINETTLNITRYKIYRRGGGELYLINILQAQAASDSPANYVFKDSGLAADESRSVVIPFNYFNSTDNYPAACGVFNQRLALGGTNTRVDSLWLSRIGLYEDFTNTVVLADDESFSKILTGGGVNRIKHLEALDDLMCLSDGKIWRIQGTNNNDFKSFTESKIGSGDAKPLPTRKSMLFVESNENTISDFIFRDSVAGYDGNKLDILARSLFRENEITDMSFQNSPNGVVHAVRSDGKMPVLTYLKNQDVYAWTYYETAGDYESVISLDKRVFDDTYVVVKRIINGQTKRFVELFKYEFQDVATTADDWYVDSGLEYNGDATNLICGLDHLIGESVSVYADSNAIGEDFTVDADGCILLPKNYSRVLAGLPYYSVQKLITPEVSEKDGGTTIGKERRIVKATISTFNSRGFFYSSDGVNWEQSKTMDAGEIGDPIPKETRKVTVVMDVDSDVNATLYLSQRLPLPLQVLNVTLAIEFGETNAD